jgi:integrase
MTPIKAMTREQIAAFVAAAEREAPRFAPLFLTHARSGVRLGEALALHWQDLDLEHRQIRVARAFSRGRLDTPKSEHGRTVDMSHELAERLRRLSVERKAKRCGADGVSYRPGSSRRRPARRSTGTTSTRRSNALKAATLPAHFSPHALRHSFASLLLQHGVAGLRTAPARARIDPAHGRHLRA